MRGKMTIQLCTYSNGDKETWITCPSVKALADYFSDNCYRQALIAVKRRETFFHGYKIRYLEE